MKKILLLILFACMSHLGFGQSTFYTLDFESTGGYTVSPASAEFNDGAGDFFTRTDGSDLGPSYTVNNPQGGFFFSAMDLDGDGEDPVQSILISNIDISGKENLMMQILLAEDDANDSNEDWDDADFMLIEYQIDGGAFQNLLQVANDGSQFNSVPSIDTDFDGIGDGTELTEDFADFMANISGTGSLMNIRITFALNSGDEDISIDNIRISGDDSGTPTPVTVTLSVDNTTINEDGGLATITATLNKDTTVAITLDGFTIGGTATAIADYTSSSLPMTLTIPAGSTTTSITVTAVNDALNEGDETIIGTITATAPMIAIGTPNSVTITITDDDAPSTDLTIAQLRALYDGTNNVVFSDDTFITGVVISTPNNTNNQNIVLQDATAGIALRFNATHSISRGDSVRVNLNGGTITDFNDLVQVGGLEEATSVESRGTTDLPAYQTLTISEFVANYSNYESELVAFSNVAFVDADGTETMSGNQEIFIGSDTTIVRTGSGAPFASEIVPSGSGTVRGIAAIFGGTAQIFPQVFSEDVFGSTASTDLTIAQLRTFYDGTNNVTFSDDTFITGVVISTPNNTNNQNIVLQDATAGIALRFNATHSISRGDSVRVNLNGGTITDFNDLVQVGGLEEATSVESRGTTDLPAYQTLTISEFVANYSNYESELVAFSNVAFVDADGTETMSGNQEIFIGSDTTIVRTGSGAPFASEIVPSGSGTVRGIAAIFGGTAQIFPQVFSEDIFASTATTDLTIAQLRALYDGTNNVVFSDDTFITGVVISTPNNTNNQNIVLQDATAGIALRFNATHSISRGDSVRVNLNGGTITDFNDLVQVGGLEEATSVESRGTTDLPAYQTLTISEFVANYSNYESELVAFSNVAFVDADGTETMSGNQEIFIGSDTTIVRTGSGAPFASEIVPSGSGTVRGIAAIFGGTAQIFPQVFSEDVFASTTAPLISVSLSADNSSINENGGTATVTATLSTDTTVDVTVSLAYAGTATTTADYTGGASITITAGNTTGTTTISSVDDSDTEGNETAIVSIASTNPAIQTGTTNSVTITINDDDTPVSTATNISTVRALYTGTAVDVTTDLFIEAVVISIPDNTGSLRNITVQDETAGIVLRFNANSSLTRGDSIRVNLNGGEIATFGDVIQVNGIDETTAVETRGTGTLPAYQMITIAEYRTNYDQYESELVSFANVNFVNSDGTTVFGDNGGGGGDQPINIGLDTITVRTDNDASFAGELVPSGTGTVRGIATRFNASLQVLPQVFNEDVFPVFMPMVTLNIAEESISENGGTATVTATLSATTTADAIVRLSFAGTANSSDYTALADSIIITAGSTSGTTTIIALADGIEEPAETIIVSISSVKNGIEDGEQTDTVEIEASGATDNTPPAVAILGTPTSTTGSVASKITFEFSEDVTGFTLGDISLGNATATNFIVESASLYTADITPTATGTVTINVNANVANDLAGNGNTAATQTSFEVDASGPTATITTNAVNGTENPSIVYTVTFSEEIDTTSVNSTDFVIIGGGASVTKVNRISATVYEVTITVTTFGNPIALTLPADKVQDLAGNGNDFATSSNLVTDLADDLAKFGVNIFANESAIFLQFANVKSAESNISVYDLSGKVIFQATNNKIQNVEINSIQSGIYVVRMQNEAGILTRRVLVK